MASLEPRLKFRILTVKFSSLSMNPGLTKFHSLVLSGIVMLDTQQPLVFWFASRKATLAEGASPISLLRRKNGGGDDGIDRDLFPSVRRGLLTIVSISEVTLPFFVKFSRVFSPDLHVTVTANPSQHLSKTFLRSSDNLSIFAGGGLGVLILNRFWASCQKIFQCGIFLTSACFLKKKTHLP